MNQSPHERLHDAMEAYRQAFGHAVPANVAAMFAAQPGALVTEIRQALALRKPVPAWRSHAKDAASAFATSARVF
jgi:hypothetical protein